MKKNNVYLLSGVLMISCATALPVIAEAQKQAAMESVQVFGKRVSTRTHVDTIAPKLVYDTSFFQQFEPISVGDMLKRVPGVSFNSDVGEYDAPRLRGIDSKYTQVLINGRRLPGAENDGSVQVDRIPAEIVERIEIIRSPSADMDSQGIGGSLNIILKEGASLEGGVWRIGAVDMEKTRGSGFLSYGGTNGKVQYGVSINVQERYNPKEKYADKVEEEEREVVNESDVRDSTDISLSGELVFMLDNGGDLGVRAYFLDTEREEEENASVDIYERPDADSDFDFDGTEIAYQKEDIERQNMQLSTDYTQEFDANELKVFASYHELEVDEDKLDMEADEGEPLEFDARELTEITDEEIKAGASWLRKVGDHSYKFGIELSEKERDFSLQEVDEDSIINDENDEFSVFIADESRQDVYGVGTWKLSSAWELETGIRVENTDIEMRGRNFNNREVKDDNDNTEVNPSLHLRWRISEQDNARMSVARTVRRPEYDLLNPVVLAVDDELFVGNVDLDSETAIGFDLGYEHFMGKTGVVGLGVFYREVEDIIEFNKQDVVIGGEEFELRSPINNKNDGKIWGAELDLSAPITEDLQVFLNYTWLDSEVDDAFLEGVEREFSGQAEYVYNLGFEHNIRAWDVSYGASYQQQGDATEFEGGEVNRISYDGNLEIFIEKKLGKDYILRLTGQNLLDAEKEELIKEYEDGDAYRAGTADSREVEVEDTSPAVIVTLRGRF